MIKKRIIFFKAFEKAMTEALLPISGSKVIPTWFRSIEKFKKKDIGNDLEIKLNPLKWDLTSKSCIPVTDSFLNGYYMCLSQDLKVSLDAEGRSVIECSYHSNECTCFDKFRTWSDSEYYDYFIEYDNYEKIRWGWKENWGIKTPKGYSSMLIHPLNRLDLPFYTIDGIVDTDKWGIDGIHPFVLKKGWTGVIPKGTPIIQIIPFKRNNWKAYVNKKILGYAKQYDSKYKRHFYRDEMWSKKRYE